MSSDNPTYLAFQPIPTSGTTKAWEVYNVVHGSHIGVIRWFGRWRQYCFFPNDQTVFHHGCLSDIAKFVLNATNEWRRERGKVAKPAGSTGNRE